MDECSAKLAPIAEVETLPVPFRKFGLYCLTPTHRTRDHAWL